MFTYFDPQGRNLISQYRSAALSLEDSQAVQDKTVKTPGEVVYSGEIPPP